MEEESCFQISTIDEAIPKIKIEINHPILSKIPIIENNIKIDSYSYQHKYLDLAFTYDSNSNILVLIMPILKGFFLDEIVIKIVWKSIKDNIILFKDIYEKILVVNENGYEKFEIHQLNHISMQILPKQNKNSSQSIYSISYLAFLQKCKNENIGPILQCSKQSINLKFLETYLQPSFDRKDFLKLLFNYFPVWQRLALLKTTHQHQKLIKMDPLQQLSIQFIPQSLNETSVLVKQLNCTIVFHLGRADPEMYPEIRTLIQIITLKQSLLKHHSQQMPHQSSIPKQNSETPQQSIQSTRPLVLNIGKFMEVFEYNQRIKDQPYGKIDKQSANFAFRYNPSNYQDFDVIEQFFVNLLVCIYCNIVFKRIKEGMEKELPQFIPEINPYIYKIDVNFPELIVSYNQNGQQQQLVKISYEVKQTDDFSITYEGFYYYLEQMLKNEKNKALERTSFIAAIIYLQSLLQSGVIKQKVLGLLENVVELIKEIPRQHPQQEKKRDLEIQFATLSIDANSFRPNLQMLLKPIDQQQQKLICNCQILEDKLLILKNRAFLDDYEIKNKVDADLFVKQRLFSDQN